jgi:hypothetical protein
MDSEFQFCIHIHLVPLFWRLLERERERERVKKVTTTGVVNGYGYKGLIDFKQ